MSERDPSDGDLQALLAPESREADQAFVRQTMRLVAAEAAWRAARRQLLADWCWNMAAFAALVAGLALLSRLPILPGFAREGWFAIASPLVLVVVLWIFASGSLSWTGGRGWTRAGSGGID